MWNKVIRFSALFFIVLVIGCGVANNKAEDQISGIGISVPLASITPCGQAMGQITQTFTGSDGQCYAVTFIGYTSAPINLPFPNNEIQTIRLEVSDPSGGKHVVGYLNQNQNTSAPSGGFLYLTDAQNSNQPIARITFQGPTQAMIEIDLSGSQTMAQLYQTYFQSQTTIQMQLIFVKNN